MKRNIPRFRTEQKAILAEIERWVLRPAEDALEKNVVIETATLSWLVKVAKRAPRLSGGRPIKSLLSKESREKEILIAREQIARLKGEGKKPDGKPPTGKQISAIVRELAGFLDLKESYVEDLLTRKAPRKKKVISPN